MNNTYRDKKGQYASLALKAERMAGIALILAVALWHVHDANKPLETHLTALQRQVVELQVQAAELEDKAAKASVTLTDPTKYLTKHKGFATAYSCGGLNTPAEILMNCPSKIKHPNGKTATGTTPDPNRTIACDPANLGKTFLIEGVGIRTCEDTGGAIKGAGRFDIYLPHVAQARAFGGQEITYKIIK